MFVNNNLLTIKECFATMHALSEVVSSHLKEDQYSTEHDPQKISRGNPTLFRKDPPPAWPLLPLLLPQFALA